MNRGYREAEPFKPGDVVLYEGQRRVVEEVVFGKVGGPHYRLKGCPFLAGQSALTPIKLLGGRSLPRPDEVRRAIDGAQGGDTLDIYPTAPRSQARSEHD